MSCEVMILNLRPMDNFDNWPRESENMVEDILNLGSRYTENYLCRSQFLLKVEDTFFVKQVQKFKKSENDENQWTIITDIREKLRPFSEDYPQHSAKLLEFCKASKLDPSKYGALEQFVKSVEEKPMNEYTTNKKLVKKQEKRVERSFEAIPDYAFFNTDSIDFPIKITEAVSPNEFYVQLLKFQQQLKALEQDLKTDYESYDCQQSYSRSDGDFFIVKWDEEQYYRVEYLEDMNELFFVDFGYIESLPEDMTLVPITKLCLERLPFQAIRVIIIFFSLSQKSAKINFEICVIAYCSVH